MKINLQFRLLVVLGILLATLPTQTAQAAPTAFIAPTGLLQFTSGGHALGFTSDGMYAATGSHALHVSFVGANSVQPQADASASAYGKAAPLGRVVYTDLWDGISLTYAASEGSIYRTTFSLAPGAEAKNIRLRYNAPLTLNKDGTLRIAFETGAMTESAPIAWQEIQGKRIQVDVSFQVHGQEVSFALGTYNPSHALLIDPRLIWNTFLGGSGSDVGRAIAEDVDGNIYVTGWSTATWGDPERPFTPSTYDTFVAKLDMTGALLWSTFLGGSVDDYGYAIAEDDNGVYVAGTSGGSLSGGSGAWGCPTDCTARDFISNGDAFVARLAVGDGELLWNTFLGANGIDYGFGIVVEYGSTPHLFVVGESTVTWESPVRAFTTATKDAFAAKLEFEDGSLIWNTFLGGSGGDSASGVTLDGSNLYMAGSSSAAWSCSPVECTERDFTTSYLDAFAVELSASTGVLIGNTFLGGSGTDYGSGIAVDATSIYVAGYSDAHWGNPERAYSSGYDAFAAKLSRANGILTWNTFLGQNGTDYGFDIAVDASGIYVVGYSNATWGNPQRAFTQATDAFIAKLDSSGALAANTFLGGSGGDFGYGIITDWDGSGVNVAGYSEDSWGCSPKDCTQRAYTSGADAFAAKVDLSYWICLPLVRRD